MNVVNIPATPQRALFQRLEKVMMDVGVPGNSVVSPYELRVEQDITGSKTSYEFNLYQSQSDNPIEKKLNRNDGFFISHFGLGVYKLATADEEGQERVLFWPDPDVFSAANEADAIRQFYNGKLTLKTTPLERMRLSTRLLEYNPGVVNDTTNFYAAYGNSFVGPTLEQKGLFPVDPSPILDGNDDNEVVLTLGPGDASAAGTPADNKVVLLVYGFLVERAGGYFRQIYRQP